MDSKINSIITKFQRLIPLHLAAAHEKEQSYWVDNNLPSRQTLAIMLYALQHSANLNDFIAKSSADFDSVAELVRLAVEDELIDVDIDGNVKNKHIYTFPTNPSIQNKSLKKLVPREEYNQFPCDDVSKEKRKLFIKHRYPYAEHLKFGIIGDDDLISLQFLNESWALPVVVEKDDHIVDLIRSNYGSCNIINTDVCNIEEVSKINDIQTFITDPPYTLHGSLAFIFCGLSMMSFEEEKEFYVILNSTMMGKNFFRLQKILADSEIFLTHVMDNFSQYDLPNHYEEKKRSQDFLQKNSMRPDALFRSSSSSLYIFSTSNPNLLTIKKRIDYSKIYNHYDH